MSTESAISMRELEAESAELLPSRETLCVPRSCYHASHSSFTSNSAGNGIGNAGNTAQSGNGDFSFLNGNLSDNTVNILSW